MLATIFNSDSVTPLFASKVMVGWGKLFQLFLTTRNYDRKKNFLVHGKYRNRILEKLQAKI
jgi:hypothetical protein